MLNNNMNRKGQLTAMMILAIALGIVILIIGLTLGFTVIFSKGFLAYLIGGGLIVLTLIYGLRGEMNKTKKNFMITMIVIGVAIIAIGATGVLQTSYTGNNLPSNVKLAVPVNGAYFCTSVGTGNPSYTIPAGGLWISKSSIGVYTDQVTSINVYVPQVSWTTYFLRYYLGGGSRAYMKQCDVNQQNCKEISPQSLTYAGTTTLNLPFTSLNPQTSSLYIVIQSKATILSSWQNNDALGSQVTVNYAYTKYGLKYVSTSGNPAGQLFTGCESSCDLTCPTQKSRGDTGLLYTAKNSLLPAESVPVLEYWNTLDVDLNAEMGATIYDSNKNQFCFGGAIYTAVTKTLDNGNTYIYPDTATRHTVPCCNGATISTSTEDKTCINNALVTVTKDTRLKCTSDFNCPGQGQYTCQNKISSGWHCGTVESTGYRYCKQDTVGTQVQCCSQADCPTDQTCQGGECVGGGVTPPVTPGMNESSSKVACNNAAQSNPFMGYQWVDTSTTSCGFWCSIGLSIPTTITTGYCKAAFVPYYIAGIVVLILVIIIVVLLVPKKRKQIKGRS